MKTTSLILIALLAFVSCKKKENPPPEEPAKTGTLQVKVVTYDSIGNINNDHSGVKVLLNGTSVITGSDGIASFPNLSYGDYSPSLVKDKYDSPILVAHLTGDIATVTVPFPSRSPYYVTFISGNAVSATTMTVDLSLNKPLPPNTRCRMVVLADTVPTVNPKAFNSADTCSIDQQNVSAFNLGTLTELGKFVNKLSPAQAFHVMMVPVSYGLYQSNAIPLPIVLGKANESSKYVRLTRNW